MTTRLDRLSPVKSELYAWLRGRRADSARTGGLVPLRDASSGAGVVLVHPVGGSLVCYVPLLARLPADVAVVGFAAETPSDRPADELIAALANRYLTALSARARPDRTWCYAGWSFGGAVAYEMGRSAGAGSAVVMLDTDRPAEATGATELSESTVHGFFIGDLVRAAGTPTLGAAAAPENGHPARLPTVLDRLDLAVGLTEAELADRYRIYAENTRALAAYQPGRHAGPVTLVRSGRPPGVPIDWSRSCSALTVRDVLDADHYTLLQSPYVDAAARAIVEAIQPSAVAVLGEERSDGLRAS